MIYYGVLGLLNRSSVARRMMIFVSLTGVLYGFLQLGEVIARKSLGATGLQITLLTMAMPVMQLTSIWWGRLLMGRDQRAILWIGSIIGLAAIATGYFLESYIHLLLIFIIYFTVSSLQATANNRPIQQYIPAKSTGGLFGLSFGLRMGLAAAVAAIAGIYMDKVDKGWQEMFLITAIIGMIASGYLASIKTKTEISQRTKNWMTEPWKGVFELLKRRPDYLRFEIAFMIYGIAFMMTLPIIPIFLVDDLKWDYSIIGLARGAAFQIVMIIGVPIFGKIFDRSTPHRLGVICFGILAFFPLSLAVSKYFDGIIQTVLVFTGFGIFGVGLSGVILLWNLASMRFTSPGEDAGVYQSVHIAATGIRGLFAPMMGYAILHWFGTTTALIAASGVWLLSSIFMLIARKIDFRSGKAVSLRAID